MGQILVEKQDKVKVTREDNELALTVERNEVKLEQEAPREIRLIRAEMGAPGRDGIDADASYTHNQMAPAAQWVINHDLGFVPGGILVKDSAGSVVVGDVIQASATQLIIEFGSAFGGTVNLS